MYQSETAELTTSSRALDVLGELHRPDGGEKLRPPAIERAVIEPAKLRDYLLSSSHPVGRFKAAFFRSLGYAQADWRRLELDLRELVASGDGRKGRTTTHGQKVEVLGTLRGPSGRQARIVTVWIVSTGEDVSRFVTAYPLEDA